LSWIKFQRKDIEEDKIRGGLSNIKYEEIPRKIQKMKSVLSNLINHWFGKVKMRYVSKYKCAYCHIKKGIGKIVIGSLKI